MSHVTGEVPGWQHEPWQVSHSTAVSTSMSRWTPKTTSPRSSVDAHERVLAALAARARPAAALPPGRAEERLEDVAEPAEAAAAAAAERPASPPMS